MKKLKLMGTLILFIFALSACAIPGSGDSSGKIVTNRESDSTGSEDTTTQTKQSEEKSEEKTSEPKKKEAVSEDEAGQEVTDVVFDEQIFADTLTYIKKTGDQVPAIDYSAVKYKPGVRNEKLKAPSVEDDIDNSILDCNQKTIRMYRKDNGATIDFVVYTEKDSNKISKIISTEYGSDGRNITNFYFKDGSLNYVFEYMDDLYGLTYSGDELSGLKCYFAEDTMVECYELAPAIAKKSITPYLVEDYGKYDELTQTEFDNLEANMINQAYTNYNVLKDIPAVATLSGYVGDEYGGVLSNVHIQVQSNYHNYKEEFMTNGDGYFEIKVPINNDDWYGIDMTYGEFVPVSIDDIYIPSGTLDYSLGVTYMAAKGETKHDTEYYLLDVTKRAPDQLKENQYEIIATYNEDVASLKPYTFNLKSGDTWDVKNEFHEIVTVDEDSRFKYFLTDQRGGRSDNTMTYEMSTSNAQIKVYNKDGLVASYQVPVNHAGVVWEVFEINGLDILPINNYYYEVGKEVFFQ